MTPWLFSRRVDLGVFLGSAVASLALLAIGAPLGLLDADAPDWVWMGAVLAIDVAHVWSTAFRVYLDPVELRRRPLLYAAVPAIGYGVAVALYAAGPAWFWRALAYLAVFHFVRQQVGWVALYRARAGETGRLGAFIDKGAAYAATVYPLVHWHTHLPRRFHWFVDGDFAPILPIIDYLTLPVYCALMLAYAVRALRSPRNPGKHIVVATTAVCWWAGIVAFDSDYAFTVTNVVIHGVPYFAIVWWHGRKVDVPALRAGLTWFLVPLVGVAFVEEMIWDRALWHDRAWLFGGGWSLGDTARTVVVPLLAVPQLTHYVLDGFIWRRRSNPGVAGLSPPHQGDAKDPPAAGSIGLSAASAASPSPPGPGRTGLRPSPDVSASS